MVYVIAAIGLLLAFSPDLKVLFKKLRGDKIPKAFREVLGKEVTEEQFLATYDVPAMRRMLLQYTVHDGEYNFLHRMIKKASVKEQLEKGLYE